MNANQIVNMVLRQLMREGINAAMAGIGSGDDMTPNERRKVKQASKAGQKTTQKMRAARRIFLSLSSDVSCGPPTAMCAAY